MSKKEKIKVGDWVRIENPEFFVRCGYPLCLADVQEKLGKELGNKIDDFIDEVMEVPKLDRRLSVDDRKNREVYERILYALSRFYIAQNRFGGAERKIYTKTFPEYQGRICRVEKKSFKMTGVYVSGFSSVDYFGEGEYEPAYLSKAKRHTLLHIVPYMEKGFYLGALDDDDLEPIIEDIHVEKVEKNHPEIFCELVK